MEFCRDCEHCPLSKFNGGYLEYCDVVRVDDIENKDEQLKEIVALYEKHFGNRLVNF